MVFCGSLRAGCSGIVAPLLKRTLWIWEPKGHNTAATHYPKVVLQDHHPTASYQKSSGVVSAAGGGGQKKKVLQKETWKSGAVEKLRGGSRVKGQGEWRGIGQRLTFCSLLNLLVLCAQCNAENVTQQSLWVPNLAVGNTHVGANHWRPACKRSGSLWWRLILSHFNPILSLYIKES